MIRMPIIAFLGHVDAGKTTLQDFIRKSAVAKSEPGEITQSIGASIVPAHTINTLCSPLLKQLGIELKIPGLLMIDTPGHAAFVSLRKRGGTLADLAVLVVDIKEVRPIRLTISKLPLPFSSINLWPTPNIVDDG